MVPPHTLPLLLLPSISADGRAVMRSSIREFIASEAMEALGVSEHV